MTDELEGGPELGGITAEILVDRLLVKLINDPFDIPTADVFVFFYKTINIFELVTISQSN